MQIRANANENQVISVNSAAQERAAQRAGTKAQKNSSNKATIFAGDLGLGMQNDIVTLRKQRAQRKALKMITDAWNGDRKTDQTIADYQDKIRELKADMEENQDIVQRGEAHKEELRQLYGVAEDSQEQKDLELLEKEAVSKKHYANADSVYLTDEEQKRLDEIHAQGLTEYQERCMDIDKQQEHFEKKIDDIKTEIKAYSNAIAATKLERLKYHDMVDAQEKAEDLLEAASKEAIGLLVDEAKDHVDEEFEEQVEEAKKKAEEKAEKEEKIEERKEKQEELETRVDAARAEREEQEERRREAEERSRDDAEILDSMLEAGMGGIGVTKADVKAAIKEMLHKMKLLEEDIKGSLIDEELSDY